MSDGPTRVAVACQGGGSHTAFTAGVLERLLPELDGEEYELVGISGTSGGAFNALVTWYGLVTEGPERSVELLGDLWEDLSASDPTDRWVNRWLVGLSRVEASGLPVPQVSPYDNPGTTWGRDRIAGILERHVDFQAIPDLCERRSPRLVVGTVDVNGGEFETFVDEAVTTEAVLASAAVPNLFEGVEIHGHLHWDGLFSQNPPINDLLDVDVGRKPEELWVIQINPQKRAGVPTSLEEIADRRNELSGNISLNQELRFVERVNQWIEDGMLPEEKFQRVDIRRIGIDEELHYSTKLDRSPEFITKLQRMGRTQAGEFLDAD